MASVVEVVNASMTLLGEDHITSLEDDVKAAREAKAIYEIQRDALLGEYNWSFAKTRAQLPALATAPPFQYQLKYQMPSDCLRLIMVGDYYAGLDLTDYRSSPTEIFTIEEREILTDMSAPLNIIYIKRATDPSKWNSVFTAAMAARMAAKLAESLTQSKSKREAAEAEETKQIKRAIRSNAIELPPQKLADDEWLMSRL